MKRSVWVLVLAALLLGPASAAPLKVRVTTQDAGLKAAPDVGSNTLIRLPLDTLLQVEEKQGEWYKVTLEAADGKRLTGYIHELLVTPVEEPVVPPPVKTKEAPPKEAPPKDVPAKEAPAKEPPVKEAAAKEAAPADRAQIELVAELEAQLDRCRTLIRQDGSADEALALLSPLAARALRIVDRPRQQQITTEVFFLKGLALAAKGDDGSARKEFRNMYEVSEAEARALVRNIFDGRIVALLKQAEGEYLGFVTEYAIEIISDPAGARVKADGRELGAAPVVYKTSAAKVLVEIDKDGYKPVREDMTLAQPSTRKIFKLEAAFFGLSVRSVPPGARVFLDGKDTGQSTNAELVRLPVGPHQVRLVKEFHADVQVQVDLQEGAPNRIEVLLLVSSYAAHGVWGGPGSPFFKNPAAIAIDKEDRILVVDESPVKLKIFNRLGEVIGGGGQVAVGLAPLAKPAAVAVDGRGHIYVADSESHAVFQLDATGRILARWGKFGADAAGLNTPLGLAVDAENNIYVVDSGNSRIKKYSPSGDVLETWGRAGSGQGEFAAPRAVALNAKGEIFVLDSRRVQKFSPRGEWLSDWGRLGSADGEFRTPYGLLIDAAGSVFVADSGNHRIQKFDGVGRWICSWGSNGKESGLFDFPVGIAMDGAGIVYVVDRNNQRIQLFTAGASAFGGASPLEDGAGRAGPAAGSRMR
jgi:DNA-binding beta-propeller fold protein YncE